MATLHYGTETFEIGDDLNPKEVLYWFTSPEGSWPGVTVTTPDGPVHLLRVPGVPVWVDARESRSLGIF